MVTSQRKRNGVFFQLSGHEYMRWFLAALAVFALWMSGWWLVREHARVAEELAGVFNTPVSTEGLDASTGCRAQFQGIAKLVRPGAQCFYWTLPEQQKTVAAECQALRLNYALWPARVLYRDDHALATTEYILVHPNQAGDLTMRLFEYELQTGRAWTFKEIGRNDDIVVLKRIRGGGATP